MPIYHAHVSTSAQLAECFYKCPTWIHVLYRFSWLTSTVSYHLQHLSGWCNEPRHSIYLQFGMPFLLQLQCSKYLYLGSLVPQLASAHVQVPKQAPPPKSSISIHTHFDDKPKSLPQFHPQRTLFLYQSGNSFDSVCYSGLATVSCPYGLSSQASCYTRLLSSSLLLLPSNLFLHSLSSPPLSSSSFSLCLADPSQSTLPDRPRPM
jgi:hypothetical protein